MCARAAHTRSHTDLGAGGGAPFRAQRAAVCRLLRVAPCPLLRASCLFKLVGNRKQTGCQTLHVYVCIGLSRGALAAAVARRLLLLRDRPGASGDLRGSPKKAPSLGGCGNLKP